MLGVPFLFIAGSRLRLLQGAAAGDPVPAELQRGLVRRPDPGAALYKFVVMLLAAMGLLFQIPVASSL
jgi:hypothetical protein